MHGSFYLWKNINKWRKYQLNIATKNKKADSYYHNIESSITHGMVQLYQKICCSINTCIYIFKYRQIKFSYYQVISLIHRNICENESCNLYGNFAATMPENIYVLPCGFLNLHYLNFKAFQSKLEGWRQQYYLFD